MLELGDTGVQCVKARAGVRRVPRRRPEIAERCEDLPAVGAGKRDAVLEVHATGHERGQLALAYQTTVRANT